jgi:hypothetical protein
VRSSSFEPAEQKVNPHATTPESATFAASRSSRSPVAAAFCTDAGPVGACWCRGTGRVCPLASERIGKRGCARR